jgi:hypothetical protein
MELHLYVWEDCFTDYTDGFAFAIAPDVSEARRMIAEVFDFHPSDLDKEPTVYPLNQPIAKAVYGGG